MFTTDLLTTNQEIESPTKMIDNLAPDLDKQINTTFLEQRVVNTEKAYPSTSMTLSKRVESEMSDSIWMAKHQLMKPIQLAQRIWSTSNARSTEIYSATIPGVIADIESIVLRTLRMYAFYKMSPVFRVQINSTQFHQGQLICCFDPFSYTQIDRTSSFASEVVDNLNIFYATGLPNVKIMASESDAVELQIPFIHPKSFLTTNTPYAYNNLGTFKILVLNPLMVAEGSSPNLTVTIWMYPQDAEVHVPIFDHDPILEATSGNLTEVITNILIEPTSGNITQSINSISKSKKTKPKNSNFKQTKPNQNKEKLPHEDQKQEEDSMWDNLKGGFQHGKNMVGNLITGNWGQALRDGWGLVGKGLSLFGFDYPARTITPDKTITPVENLGITIGKSQSQRMAMNPFSMHLLEDDIAAESLDAMDLARIVKIPMLISQFTFTNVSQQGDVLFQIPIHPCIGTAIGTLNQQQSYLSFVSRFFSYWSGGLKYDIEVVATRFHSGKLLFAYVPNTIEQPTYQQAATSLPNVIIDIQQTSSTTFKAPYTSPTAMKSTIFDSTADISVDPDTTIGLLVCYVQNTLAFASNVAPNIEINVYVSADEDYSLYIPRVPLITNSAPLEPTSGTISIMDQKNNPSNTEAVMSKDQDDSLPRVHFGEQYSLIDLLRRFSYERSVTLFTDTQATGTLNFNQLFSTEVQPSYWQYNSTTETILTYFSRIYSCWSGTIRYKFISPESRLSNTLLSVVHIPETRVASILNTTQETTPGVYALVYPYQAEITGYAALRTNLSQDNAIEAEIPFYSKYNMILTRTNIIAFQPINDISNNGMYNLFTQNRDTFTTNVDIYTAAGEDFRFIYLRPPPLISINNSYVITSIT